MIILYIKDLINVKVRIILYTYDKLGYIYY